MIELIESNWLAFALVGILALLIALWLLVRSRKPAVRTYRPDVLDEGVARAGRNQALIDAPPAADSVAKQAVPPASEGMMGAGAAGVAVADVASDDTVFEPNEPEVTEASAVAAAAKIEDGDGVVDDLSKIKGLGPKLVALLGSMGISRYDQIAAWSDEDVANIDAQLGKFAGRIERDDWRSQARFLAEGDTVGYEGKFGKL